MASILKRRSKALIILAYDRKQIEMLDDQIERWGPTQRKRWVKEKMTYGPIEISGGQLSESREMPKDIFGKAASVLGRVKRTNITGKIESLLKAAEKLVKRRPNSSEDKGWLKAYNRWQKKREHTFRAICGQMQKIAVLKTDRFVVRASQRKTKREMAILNPLFNVRVSGIRETKDLLRVTISGTITEIGRKLLKPKYKFTCISVGAIPVRRARFGAEQLEMPSFLIAK